MKTIFSILIFLMFSPSILANTEGEVQVGSYLREATLQGLSGKSRKISEFRGKPLFINVWASWCSPCRNEMASIQHLSQRFGGEKFNVIGISTDDDANAAASFIKTSKLTFENYIDSNVLLENMLGADTIPLTILVDAHGRVIRKVSGSQNWDNPELLQLIGKAFKIKIQ